MQAIQTKYLGPTNYRGARIKARCEAGSITIDYPYEKNAGEDAHRVAADALMRKVGWSYRLVGGGLPDGSYVFTMEPKGTVPWDHSDEDAVNGTAPGAITVEGIWG